MSSQNQDSLLELKVRSAIPDEFGRFEINQRDLKGTPDIVFRDRRVAVFVHGCHWHRHAGCSLAQKSVKNTAMWIKTLNTNVVRDQEALFELRQQGWNCLVFWECEINAGLEELVDKLGRELGVQR